MGSHKEMLFRYTLLTITIFFSDVFSYPRDGRRVVRQTGADSCKTPNYQPGTCLNLRNCPPLLDLMNTRGNEPEIRNFLKKSQCGKEKDGRPKVCCNIQSSTTSSTKSTTPVLLLSAPKPPSTTPLDEELEHKKKLAKNEYSTCGKSSRTASNMGGERNATLGDWPWVVAIGYRTESNPGPLFECGGSLISDRWVVTAAHCVQGIGSLTVKGVRIGDLDLNGDNYDGASPIDYPIEEIILHPEFSADPVLNDIALVRLRKRVIFSAHVRPICVSNETQHKNDVFYKNKTPFLADWGPTKAGDLPTDILKETKLRIVDRDVCTMKHQRLPAPQKSVIDHKVLCAGRTGQGSCQGDSGGPLMLQIRDHYHLIGIASSGLECTDGIFTGVYTRVAFFSDWIKRVTEVKFYSH